MGPLAIVGPSLTDTWLILPPFFPHSSQQDTTCTKEFFTTRISSQMDIIGLGRTAQGFPVHIQDNGKILFEMWLDSDEERQRLTKALEFCVKQR